MELNKSESGMTWVEIVQAFKEGKTVIDHYVDMFDLVVVHADENRIDLGVDGRVYCGYNREDNNLHESFFCAYEDNV